MTPKTSKNINIDFSFVDNEISTLSFLFSIFIHFAIISWVGFTFFYNDINDIRQIEVTWIDPENKEEKSLNAKIEANKAQKGKSQTNINKIKITTTDYFFQKGEIAQTYKDKEKNPLIRDPLKNDIKPLHIPQKSSESEFFLFVQEDDEITSTLTKKFMDSLPLVYSQSEFSSAVNELKNRISNIDDINASNNVIDPTKNKLNTKRRNKIIYLIYWINKVETMGNSYAKKINLDSNKQKKLKAQVILNADGTLAKTNITQSSGDPYIDSITKNIITLSGPFKKVPKNLLNENNQFYINRTWIFHKNYFKDGI